MNRTRYQSWKTAGKRFRDAITADRWAESLKQVRPPLGALSQRGMLATQFRKNIPGAPDGDYAIVVFRTTLMNLYVQMREEKAIDNILTTAEVEEVEPTAEQQKTGSPEGESSAT